MGRCTVRNLVNMRTYVLEHRGAPVWAAWFASLSQDQQAIFSCAQSEVMYDEAIHVQLLRSFCGYFRGGSTSIAFELGRFSAAMDLAMSRSFRFSTVRPAFMLRNIDTFWRCDHDTGSWELDIRGGELIATLRGWEGHSPEACQRLLGYITCLLESFGPIKSYSHTECRSFTAEHCRFHCRWEIGQPPTPKARVASVPDLFSALGEIALSTTVEHLFEVIVCLFRSHFACPFVRVWGRRPGRDTIEVVAIDGESRRELISIPLITGSQEVGRIEYEPAAEWPDWLTDNVLQSAASLLAYMIASESRLSLGTSAEPVMGASLSGFTLEERIDHQLELAREAWGLKPVEAQILKLLVLGTRITDIAEKLERARSTVDHHLAEVRYRAGQLDSILELIVMFWTLR